MGHDISQKSPETFCLISRADSRFAPSQWETTLLCNDVSHWLGASLESTLILMSINLLQDCFLMPQLVWVILEPGITEIIFWLSLLILSPAFMSFYVLYNISWKRNMVRGKIYVQHFLLTTYLQNHLSVYWFDIRYVSPQLIPHMNL